MHRRLAMGAQCRRPLRRAGRIIQHDIPAVRALRVMHDHIHGRIGLVLQQGGHDLCMRIAPGRGRQALIGDQPGQFVPEFEMPPRPDQKMAVRDIGQKRCRRPARHRLQQVQRHLARTARGKFEQLAHRCGQGVDPCVHGVGHRNRHDARLLPMVDNLGDEERVAAGNFGQPLGGIATPGGDLAYRLDGQRRQEQLGFPRRGNAAKRGAQRMCRLNLVIAKAGDQQDGQLRDAPPDIVEPVQTALIRPMQILDHQNGGRAQRTGPPDEPFEKPGFVIVVQSGAEQAVTDIADRPERARRVQRVAQTDGAGHRRREAGQECVDHRRFPDTRFAANQNDMPAAFGDAIETVAQDRKSVV